MIAYEEEKLFGLCSTQTVQEVKQYLLSVEGQEELLQKYCDVFEKGEIQWKIDDERIHPF